jgi:hypothetical protein
LRGRIGPGATFGLNLANWTTRTGRHKMNTLCNRMHRIVSSKSRVKSKPPRHEGPAQGPNVPSGHPVSRMCSMAICFAKDVAERDTAVIREQKRVNKGPKKGKALEIQGPIGHRWPFVCVELRISEDLPLSYFIALHAVFYRRRDDRDARMKHCSGFVTTATRRRTLHWFVLGAVRIFCFAHTLA